MARPRRLFLLTCTLLATSACSLVPRELNLTPLWFHRTDEQGQVLEWDLLWPIVHYERTPDGGDDFRIRPLYRRVTEPEPQSLEGEATEHQFLWPLGRVRHDATESSQRLFPLWSWRAHRNEADARDVDWYFLFPFFWGGGTADGREDYFAFLPFYADIPQFVTYDRFQTILFPLYVQLDKDGHRHRMFLWPLIGTSSCAVRDHRRFHVYPFYGHDVEPGHHDRRFLLWPFFSWSTENEDTDDPVHSFLFWPFFGWRSGRTVGGWTALWPLFQHTWKQDHFTSLTLFWPLFHYYWNRAEDHVTQWWLWPFVGRVHSDDQRSWSALWPLVWWREYDDPDGRTEQQWVLPFWWHVDEQAKVGGHAEFEKLWPMCHRTDRFDAEGHRTSGDWSLLSPWPWREGNATGMRELYGFLWELAYGWQRAPDDDSVDVLGRVVTWREHQGSATGSVPFLGSYERTADGNRTLRLLQFLPIPLGKAAPEETAR